jgi:uncharacterized protein (TIGR02453 family)
MSTQFAGFPDGTFVFLRELADHNDREWFEAHRSDYQAFWLEPAMAFVSAVGPRLQEISESVNFEPGINGSIFRINRDVRFSRDKSPYKTTLDLWFWHGERKGWESPGFFFRLEPDELILGAGMHRFNKDQLTAFRQAIIDPKLGKSLEETLQAVRRSGSYQIGGKTLVRVPRGYESDHSRAHLLRHQGLWAELVGGVPATARTPRFVDVCAGHFAAMWPVSEWLLRLPGLKVD